MLQHAATHGLQRDACSKVFGPARPRACKALLPEKALHGSHHGLGGFTITYLEIRYSVHKLCQGWARLAESTLKHSLSLIPLADVVDGQNPHPHNGQNHYLTMGRTPRLQWVEFPRKKNWKRLEWPGYKPQSTRLHHMHCNPYVRNMYNLSARNFFASDILQFPCTFLLKNLSRKSCEVELKKKNWNKLWGCNVWATMDQKQHYFRAEM